MAKGVKRKKRDMQEEKLLQQAIDCMEQKKKSSDEDEIYGQYVATELHSIKSPQAKRYTKWQVRDKTRTRPDQRTNS